MQKHQKKKNNNFPWLQGSLSVSAVQQHKKNFVGFEMEQCIRNIYLVKKYRNKVLVVSSVDIY